MSTKQELLLKTSIDFNGKTYNIVNSFEATDLEGMYDFIVYETDESKIKNFFAWYPLWIGNKFRWFKQVSVKYIYYISIRNEFDEWNYLHYWDKPKGRWKMIEILN